MGDKDDEGGGEESRVPRWRLNEVIEERNLLRTKFASLNNDYTKLQEDTKGVAGAVKERDEWKTKYEGAAANFTTDLRLAEFGFDADGREVARLLHGRLPNENRPDITDWVKGFQQDAAKAPPALRAYLPTGTKEPEKKAEGAAPTAPAAPQPSAGQGAGLPRSAPATQPGGTPAGGAAATAEAIAAAVAEARRTGDWSGYNALLGRPAGWKPTAGR